MKEDAGYIVEIKNGKRGRTYHREGLINKKMVVHIEENGKVIKMLCDPETTKIIGFID